MSSFLPDILTSWRARHLVTVEELADWAEVPVATMYKVMAGERDLPFLAVRRISREASRTRGLNDIAAALLASTFEVCRRPEASANGTLDDEIADLTIAAGRGALAHRGGDVSSLDRSIADAERAVNRMKAERHLLAGGPLS